jgi:hypothetical protein
MLDGPNCGTGKEAALRIDPAGTIAYTRASARSSDRARVRGKFLCAGADNLYRRGVTHGTFHLGERGQELPAGGRSRVRLRDDAGASGANTMHTYTALRPSVQVLTAES